MKVEQRKLGTITPYGKNAKKHPDDQIKKIAASIEVFGFNQPIVVDGEGVIIVGHGRYAAACYLALEEVPVLELDLDEEKARAYRLADNKLNESDWDMSLVIQELKGLSLPMLDLTGFNRSLVLENPERDDYVPAVPATARSSRGSLYQLGAHRIFCGDSTDEKDVAVLLLGTKADMIFTDPPYNVNYSGSGKNTSNGIMNDKMESAKFADFLVDAFRHMKAHTKAGAGMYIFHSDKTQAIFEFALKQNGIRVRSQLIWNKPSGGLGAGDYRSKHEPFLYASAEGQDPLFYGDRTNTTIIDFTKTEQQLMAWVKKQKEAEKNGKTTVWTMKREPVSDYVHPTQKPVELIMYALANRSKVEDIVLDPFLGSGSTLIACQKTNRLCYGMELDPKYVDVIIERWVEYTGNREIKCNGEPLLW